MAFTGSKTNKKKLPAEIFRRPLIVVAVAAALTAWAQGAAVAGPINVHGKDVAPLLGLSALSDGELSDQRGVGDTTSISDPSRSDRQLAVILWDDFKNKKQTNTGSANSGTIQLNVTVNGNR